MKAHRVSLRHGLLHSISMLLLLLLVVMLPNVGQAQFNYTTNNGTITITGYTGPGGAVTIPDTINGLPVTVIGNGAFYFSRNLTSVTLGNSVTRIGWGAFYLCGSLINVTIPNSVTSIEGEAFSFCRNLTSVTIPDSVINIGPSAFMDCTGLTSVTIPDSVTSIGVHAFFGCTGLTNLTILNSVMTIGDWALSGCTSLPYATWGEGAILFWREPCPAGPVRIPDTVNGLPVISIGDDAFKECQSLTGVTFPKSVISIGSAFSSCTSLTNLTIPDGIKSIGGPAFSACTGLTSVTLGNSVTNIGVGAFSGCTNLTVLTVGDLNPAYRTVDGILFDKSQSTLIRCPGGKAGTITIPDSVTSIGDLAFSGCTSLTSVTIPNSVTNIGVEAFRGCTSLTSITIPDSVTSIGDWAFSSCTSLTSVTISDGVTSIGYHAFWGCTNLTSTSWDAISTIYTNLGMVRLDYVTDEGAITITGYTGPGGAVIILGNINGLPVTDIAYEAFSGCTMLTSITIPDGVTNIGGHAFAECTSLTNVTIPNSVTSIGHFAFSGCTSLASVVLGSSVTNIPGFAFDGCTSLTNITFPSSVTDIGDLAFRGCASLTSVTIPNSVTRIGGGAFDECSSLMAITVDVLNPAYSSVDGVLFNKSHTALIKFPGGRPGSYTIPGSVTNLTSYGAWKNHISSPFWGCTGLTSLTISNSVTSISDGWVSFGCTSLTNITISKSVTSIDIPAFSGCSSLTGIEVDPLNPIYSSLDGVLFDKLQTELIEYPEGIGGSYTIPNGVTSIGRSAFSRRSNLTGVTIPNSVTSVGEYAFEYCRGLTSIVIPNSVTSISDRVFEGCSSLASITIGESVSNIGEGAFAGCVSLRAAYFEGQPPSLGAGAVFFPGPLPTIYYLSGTGGWGTTFGGCATAPWLPNVRSGDATFGVQTNGFGFTISWASDKVVVVEAADDLTQSSWTPVSTNTLAGGTSYFSDPQWSQYPSRFYRVRAE